MKRNECETFFEEKTIALYVGLLLFPLNMLLGTTWNLPTNLKKTKIVHIKGKHCQDTFKCNTIIKELQGL